MKYIYLAEFFEFECKTNPLLTQSGRYKINMINVVNCDYDFYINISRKKNCYLIYYTNICEGIGKIKYNISSGSLLHISRTLICNNCPCGSGNEQNENGNCGDCN